MYQTQDVTTIELILNNNSGYYGFDRVRVFIDFYPKYFAVLLNPDTLAISVVRIRIFSNS